MHPKTEQSLRSVADACREIELNLAGISLETYRNARQVQLSTERLFEIVGEALSRAERSEPEIVASIPSARNIIGMQNRITHGYDAIDHETVSTAAVKHAPSLRDQVNAILEQHAATSDPLHTTE
ncbi:hypothetical protein BH23CHL5_BH23CHL5_25480 [soil metagenome]